MRPVLTLVLWVVAGCGGCSVLFCAMAARAQGIVGFAQAPKAAGHVSFAAEPVEVVAGKPTFVELRFHVDEGFHVNSHKPLSELLIPTVLTLEPESQVQVKAWEYPRGKAFKLAIGDGDVLDVYEGEFRVRVQVVAARGENVLRGGLRYQACDKAACFPPRTLPVSVLVVGK